MLSKIINRLYADFFMPDRLNEYSDLLQIARQQNYNVHSVISFWRMLKNGQLNSQARYLILRHDVDTDPQTARQFWEIEKEHGLIASYYFRLITADFSLMCAIEAFGSESSYHYEEIATYSRQHCLRSRADLHQKLPHIQAQFAANLRYLRQETNLRMLTVASHGDFINRKLQIPNWLLLQDANLRDEMGIELEVYDPAIESRITSRFSDAPPPRYWSPSHPSIALQRGDAVVYLLTHPRHWRAAPLENLRVDLIRLVYGLRFSLCQLKPN